MDQLRKDAERIVHAGIKAVMPDAAVKTSTRHNSTAAVRINHFIFIFPDARNQVFI